MKNVQKLLAMVCILLSAHLSDISGLEDVEDVASSLHGCTAFSIYDEHVPISVKENHPASNAVDGDLNTVWRPVFADESENSTSEHPSLVLLFRCMHLVSTLHVLSGIGPYQPVTRMSIYFSTSNSGDILSSLPEAASAHLPPQPRLNPVPVWRPLLGLRPLSDDLDVDGHTLLTRGGGAAVALPAPGALLRALRLVVEDAAAGGPAAVSEVRALAAAVHNPQVRRTRESREI